MIFTVVFTTLCLLVIYVYLIRKVSTNSILQNIPFEKGLPIFGVVRNIKEPLCNYLFKLSQKHGPIYQIRFGMRNIVVLNTYEYLKAALLETGDALNGRWKAEKYVFVTDSAGLVFIDGQVWTEQRFFVMKTLREFGVGMSRSLEIVQDECIHMLDDLKQKKGKGLDIASFLTLYTFNLITKFVMNKRFSLGDPELVALRKYMAVFMTDNNPISNFALMFPFLERHDRLMKFIMWVTFKKSLVNDFQVLVEKEIKDHSRRLDLRSEGDDLIDKFLIKQHREKVEKGNVGTFTDWQLIRNTFELLMAGIDTSAIFVSWGFTFMSMYPDIQDKVYQEIVHKIGSERMPSMADKHSLVYTQAVIDEIMRLANITPLSIMHRVMSNVNIKGHVFPTDTIIIPNLFASHLDPNVWEKPLEFYPEHFLLKDTNEDLKYRPRKELIPFSIGKRQCLGESLARVEMFMFFVSILQRFQVSMVIKRQHFSVFNGKDGIVRKPDVEEFLFKSRQKT